MGEDTNMIIVNLKNSAVVIKQQKVGFSWTSLFFGGVVQIFRGNWSEFFKFWVFALITFGAWWFIHPFTANKKEIIRLLEMGYMPATDADKTILAQSGIIQ